MCFRVYLESKIQWKSFLKNEKKKMKAFRVHLKTKQQGIYNIYTGYKIKLCHMLFTNHCSSVFQETRSVFNSTNNVSKQQCGK